jgi:HD superfamily phosphohydrolase
LAAALVHDVGHGMFSHAFEDVGKKQGLTMAQYEHVSDLLIRNGEISDAFQEKVVASQTTWPLWSSAAGPVTFTMQLFPVSSTLIG